MWFLIPIGIGLILEKCGSSTDNPEEEVSPDIGSEDQPALADHNNTSDIVVHTDINENETIDAYIEDTKDKVDAVEEGEDTYETVDTYEAVDTEAIDTYILDSTEAIDVLEDAKDLPDELDEVDELVEASDEPDEQDVGTTETQLDTEPEISAEASPEIEDVTSETSAEEVPQIIDINWPDIPDEAETDEIETSETGEETISDLATEIASETQEESVWEGGETGDIAETGISNIIEGYLVLKCYTDASKTQTMAPADCKTALANDTPSSPVYASIEFYLNGEPEPADGIKLCNEFPECYKPNPPAGNCEGLCTNETTPPVESAERLELIASLGLYNMWSLTNENGDILAEVKASKVGTPNETDVMIGATIDVFSDPDTWQCAYYFGTYGCTLPQN